METQKGYWKNPNIYTALGLVIVFLYFSGLPPGVTSPIQINIALLDYLLKSIFLLAAISSIIFIFQKVVKE